MSFKRTSLLLAAATYGLCAPPAAAVQLYYRANLPHLGTPTDGGSPFTMGDPSLVDSRPDNGVADTDQGWQTFGDFNNNTLQGRLLVGPIQGTNGVNRLALTRKGGDEVGIRPNGPMRPGPGLADHGSNANTRLEDGTNPLFVNGYTARLGIRLTDAPNQGLPRGPFAGSYDLAGAAIEIARDQQGNAGMAFDVTTDAAGNQVASVKLGLGSDVSATIPGSAGNWVDYELRGMENQVSVFARVATGLNDSYSGNTFLGTAVAGMQSIDLVQSTPDNNLVRFGDCCGGVTDLNWSISHFDVFSSDMVLAAPVFEPQAPAVTGDFDSDGDVDGNDYAAWAAEFGRTNGAARAQGDSDGDADVDGQDFLNWQARFGQAAGAAGAVPEPASFVALAYAAAAAGTRRRRAQA